MAAINSFLCRLAVLLSLLTVLLFFITALRRLRYPYELEELEGYVFLSALRVFHGQPLYPPPSFRFVPYMHPPFYYFAAAGLAKCIGMSIATLRVTSILSTAGAFAMLYAIVFREVRRHLPALAAVGLYAGCYTLSGCWFDVGRLDSLFVLCILAAIYATRRLHPVFAAALWLLCFFTKQTILPVALVMLCIDWRRPRRTLCGVAALLAGCLASVMWANHLTHGWYSFYIFGTPLANADLRLRTFAAFWPADMLRPLGLVFALILANVLLTRPKLTSLSTRFYLGACSLIPLVWCVRSHRGSSENSLMPVYALLALLFGISFARLMDWSGTLHGSGTQVARLMLLFAVCAQLGAGVYNPGDFVPSPKTREELASIIGLIQRAPGDVYVMQHPYYGWLAGKPLHADVVSMRDAQHVNPAVQAELRQQLNVALTDGEFTALAIDEKNALDTLDILTSSSWKIQYTAPALVTAVRLKTSPVLMMYRR